MGVQELFNDLTIRARITDLEYKNLTPEAIKAIYYEETGKELDINEITVYHSKDYEKQLHIGNTGFDGTVIHLFDGEKNINEFIFIPRGSEIEEGGEIRPLDWADNLMSIFVGAGDGQSGDAEKFFKEILNKIEQNPKYQDIPLTKIAYGHSKGGNIDTVLQILLDEDLKFDKVYIFNDAPPTVYQLAHVDEQFFSRLMFEFDLKDHREIYSLDPEDLVNFAIEYYKDKAVNIHHIVAEEDLLYNLSLAIRGFVHLGDYTIIDTNPELSGLKDLIAEIPDDVLVVIQKFLFQYAPVYEKEGFEGLFQELTGIEWKIIQDFLESKNPVSTFINGLKLYRHLKPKVPALLEGLNWLDDHLESIIAVLEQYGYDVGDDLRGLVRDLKQILVGIHTIDIATDKLREQDAMTDLLYSIPYVEDFFELLSAFIALKDDLSGIKEYLDRIGKELGDVSDSVEAHSLRALIQALEGSEKIYDKDGNLIFKASAGGKTIHVNSTVLLQIYYKGMEVMGHKKKVLQDLKAAYYEEYIDDFEVRKRKLLAKIHDMETNYRAYKSEFPPKRGYWIPGPKGYTVIYELSGIQVKEEIPQLHASFKDVFEHLFETYEIWIQDQTKLLERIKRGIDALFRKEKELAVQIFG